MSEIQVQLFIAHSSEGTIDYTMENKLITHPQ